MTIKEFADHLGISTATVSRAFTPGTRIRPATRTHILDQARQLGYVPNPNARNLARRHSRLIGLDYPGAIDVLMDPFLIELAHGVQTGVQHAGYGLLLNTMPRPDDAIELLREWVFGRAVDGVVVVIPPDFPMESLCPLVGQEIPCVLISRHPTPDIGLPAVTLDLAEGARSALTHLRRLGHTRIGFLTSAIDSLYTVYEETLRPESLFDPRFVVETASTIADGRAAMHRLLAAPIHPTAVFCRTDILALGALRAVKDMGLRVPTDISLVGHDDITLTALSDPALTTVRIDTARIGRLATELLLTSLKQGATQGAPPIVTVGSELIVRASTAPVS